MAIKKIDLVDPLGGDYEARDKRGKAVQRELVIETHAKEWIRVDLVEKMLVELGIMACSILAGVPESLRVHGANDQMVKATSKIIDDAKSQIAKGLAGVAAEAIGSVDSFESDLEAKADLIEELHEPGVPRRPRGVAGAPKRKRVK